MGPLNFANKGKFMSFSAGSINPDQKYVGVLQLGCAYAVICLNIGTDTSEFVSKECLKKKAAEAAARVFAEKNQIKYYNELITLKKPIVTVIKKGEKWYPAHIFSDRIRQLTHFGGEELGGPQKKAKMEAELIASAREEQLILSMGIALTDKMSRLVSE